LFAVFCLAFLAQPVGRMGPPTPEDDLGTATREAGPTGLHGDLLPPGVIARLGTVRFRGDQFLLSPDGATLVLEDGDGIHLCDASTGKVRHTLRDDLGGETSDYISVDVFSPRSKHLITLTKRFNNDTLQDHYTLRLWDVASGGELWRFSVESKASPETRFSPDGRTVLCWGADETVRLFEAETGAVVRAFVLPRKPDWWTTALSPDGTILAACSDEWTLRLWRLPSGEALRTLAPQRAPIRQVVFSPDGADVAVVAGSEVRFWEVSTGRVKLTALHTGGAFAADWKTLVVLGDHAQSLAAWDVATGGRLWEVSYEFQIRDHALSPDGRMVAVLYDEAIRLHDIRTGKVIRRLDGRLTSTWLGFHCKVTFSTDGRQLFARDGGAVRRWSVTTGEELPAPQGHTDDVHKLVFSADGDTLASGGADGTVRVWDTSTGRLLRTLYGPETELLLCGALSADGKTVASAPWVFDSTVRVWDVTTGRQLYEFDQARVPVHKGQYGVAVCFSPDGTTLAVASEQTETINLRHASRGGRLGVLRQRQLIEGLVFSPDGKTLAAHPDEHCDQINLWDMDTMTARRPLSPQAGGRCIFSADGKLLACLGDYSIHVWELASGARVHTFKTDGCIATAAFTPAGGLRAVEGEPGRGKGHYAFVDVWDVIAERKLYRLQAPGGCFTALALAPDGRRLATAMWDTSILIWDLDRLGVTAGREPETVHPRNVEHLWDDLAGADAASAFRAQQRMVGAADGAVACLKNHLAPGSDAPLVRLLADLDAPDGSVREAAAVGLTHLGWRAEPALRTLLRGRPSLETRRRVEAVLMAVQERPSDPEVLRQMRAVQVLEQIGSPAACAVLENLARGGSQAFMTHEATAALNRIRAQKVRTAQGPS
jgi:WD40 repeat protein